MNSLLVCGFTKLLYSSYIGLLALRRLMIGFVRTISLSAAAYGLVASANAHASVSFIEIPPVKRAAFTVRDATAVRINEMGIRLDGNEVILYGNPHTKRYAILRARVLYPPWCDPIRKHMSENRCVTKLVQQNYHLERQGNILTLTRDCIYIGQGELDCRDFIDSEARVIVQFVQQRITSQDEQLVIAGKLWICGLEDVEVMKKLESYIRCVEIKTLGKAFNASVVFNR